MIVSFARPLAKTLPFPVIAWGPLAIVPRLNERSRVPAGKLHVEI
jgi:hypothetical protein